VGDRLDELVGQQHVEHGGLVNHDQVGVQGVVAVEGGVPAGAELQEPVQRGGLDAGELGEAFGGPAGRGGQDDRGPFGAGQGDDGAYGVALAAAGPAGEHRDLLGQRQADRRGLLGRERCAGLLPSQSSAAVQSTVWNVASRSAGARSRRSSPPASGVSARW